MNSVIVVKDVVKIFDNRRVLDHISLEIKKGEIMVILGGSGCGKTTLLKHMIGQTMPDEGSVYLFGKDITRAGEEELTKIKRRFGMCYQNGALFSSMTVGENIALPMEELTGLDKNIIKIMTRMKLDMVGLSGVADLMPSQLSGGMRKRVALARSLALDPEIVFYDEPGAGLDPVVGAAVYKLIKDLAGKLGITSVVVTHELEHAFNIADRIAMMYQGKIIMLGKPEEIKNSTEPVVHQFVNGLPDGPISFRLSGEDFIKELTG
jgi:phospholipid/cholesterol/gamma-HCH transport system ATP-binding protein